MGTGAGVAGDGVSQREITGRLGINRRMVARLLAADEPPRYQRAPTGSVLDPLEPVMRWRLAEWPEVKAPRVTEILREDHDTNRGSGTTRFGQAPNTAAFSAFCPLRGRARAQDKEP